MQPVKVSWSEWKRFNLRSSEVRLVCRNLMYLLLLPHFQNDLINLDSCIAAAMPKRQYIIDERCISSMQCRGVTRRLFPETHLLCLGLQWQESSSKSSNATKQHERPQKEVEPGWAGAKQHSKGFNVRLCWIISLVAFAIFSHFGLQVDVVTWHSQRASYLTGPACKTLGDHFWSEGVCTNLRPTQWSLWSLMWRPSCNMQTAAKFVFFFSLRRCVGPTRCAYHSLVHGWIPLWWLPWAWRLAVW